MRKTASNSADFADQARDIADQAVVWLRNDSLEALMAIGAGILLFLLLRAIRGTGCRLLERGPEPARWRTVVARVARRTHSFFLIALSADLVANMVAPPGALLTAVDFIFTVAAVIQGAIWLRELVLVLITHRAERGDPDQST